MSTWTKAKAAKRKVQQALQQKQRLVKYAGKVLYVPKSACVRGHRLRYVRDNACVTCRQARFEQLRADPVWLQKAAVYQKVWREKNPEKHRAIVERYFKKDPERARAQVSKWWKAHPEWTRAAVAKRHARQLKATPKWLTTQHWVSIQKVYDKAVRLTQETGVPHDVDHIVPLRGATVSGLHVPWNLRAIPARANRSKSNEFGVA